MARPAAPATRAPSPLARWIWPAVLAVASVAAFASATGGAFVYDDTRQIVANPLVQDPARFGEALVSDVWAFRADADEPGSNYWRPAFVLWMIVNERLFGLDPAGWHATSLLLHALVTLLAFGLLRRLGVAAPVAGAVGLVFAVHPVHVESVAWISGSPDLLLGVGVLGALGMVHAARERPAWWRWALAVAAGVLAVAAKEVGVMLPALVAVLVALFPPGPTAEARPLARPVPWRAALLAALPFVAVSAVYLAARQSVIGAFSRQGDWAHGPAEALLTAPAILAFYLRQIFLPVRLGPVYPLRPVTADALTVPAFWLPLLVVLAAAALALWLARRGALPAFGLAVFALLLLPAFNIAAFPPEHVVHDRYLYLPLLGALLLVVPPVAAWAARTWGEAGGRRRVLVGAAVVAVPLLALSFTYSRAWTSATALWGRAVATDPGSASSWTQYAAALRADGQTAPALDALGRSIALRPMAPAYIERADLLREAGRLDEAVRDLLTVVEAQPENPLSYERLAVIRQQQGRLPEAEATLRRGREAAPGQACAFTTNLGVVLYLQRRPNEARAELERAARLAERDRSPVCRTGVFHLGMLYAEQGDSPRARATWTRYLQLTEGYRDEQTLRLRQVARQGLAAD